MAASQAGGQLLVLSATPFLTRIYGSDVIGTFQFTLALAMIVAPVASARVELVVPGPVSDSFAKDLLRLSAKTLACSAGAGLALGIIVGLLGHATISESMILATAVAAVTAWSSVDNAAMLRNGLLTRLACRNLLSGLSTGVLQVALAGLSPSVWSLAGAVVVGRLVAVLVTAKGGLRRTVAQAGSSPHDRYTRSQAASSIVSALVANVSTQLPVLAGALFLSQAALGQLSVGMRLASLPLAVLGAGLTQAVTAVMGEALRRHPENARGRFLRILLTLSGIGMVSIAGVVYVATQQMSFVFGPGWSEAGRLAVPLSLLGGVQLVVVPILGIFSMIGRQSSLMRMQVARVLVLAGAVLLAVRLFPRLDLALLGYALVAVVLYGLLLISAIRHLTMWVMANSILHAGSLAAPSTSPTDPPRKAAH